jgi:Catalytic LigB subunit of aromatic ring-opening dioxygenase
MPIVYASSASHAPGMRAWVKQADPSQVEKIMAGWDHLRVELERAKADVIIALTSEHWANFFLDHIGAFCVGRGESFEGPIEPWLGVEKVAIQGDPALAQYILEGAYKNGFEPSFSYEARLDHGTMVPLSFLMPTPHARLVPIFFNGLAPPRPQPTRCIAFGQQLGALLRARPERIAIIATGGLSHDPGEKNHGVIDTDFDAAFLAAITKGDLRALSAFSDERIFAAGGGTPEVLAWMALAGVMEGQGARQICYEPVKAWATGIGMALYENAH